MSGTDYDAIVIGGGFYGTAIAQYLKAARGLPRVLVIERESQLLARASLRNQARVHNGYHYPRSYTTAYRSRVNFPRFCTDYAPAIKQDFTKFYAIPRRNSKVTARQFTRFCAEIGASLSPAPASVKSLFAPREIDEVFLAQEVAFDASILRRMLEKALADTGIEVRLNARVDAITVGAITGSGAPLILACGGETLAARYVFNCTYSGLNQFGGDFPGIGQSLKQEITEMALVRLPPALRGLALTVMDGAFFSFMPYPSRGDDIHTLSHVRYTPHYHWRDERGNDPYAALAAYRGPSRAERMLRDAARYVPALRSAEIVDAMFEVKTVLVKNEGDDGRPILFERHSALPGCYSILGGKLDNIYDVLEKLDGEMLKV